MVIHLLLATVLSAPPPPEVWDPPHTAMETPKAPPHTGVPTTWYGTAPLAVDTLALSVGFAQLVADGKFSAGPLPVLAYLYTAPLNHFLRGHADKGLVSLAARHTVLGVGALALFLADVDECGIVNLDDTPCAYDGSTGVAPLMGLLAVVALVDDVVMARQEVAPARAGLSVIPTVQVAGNQTALGLQGRF